MVRVVQEVLVSHKDYNRATSVIPARERGPGEERQATGRYRMRLPHLPRKEAKGAEGEDEEAMETADKAAVPVCMEAEGSSGELR